MAQAVNTSSSADGDGAPVAVVLPYSIGARRKFRRKQRQWHAAGISAADDGASTGDGTIPQLCAEFAARRKATGWPAPCEMPAHLLEEKIYTCDAAKYPLVAQLAAAVGAEVDALPMLHTVGEIKEWLSRPQLTNLGLNPVDRRFKASGGFRKNSALQDVYLKFLREVVQPMLPDPQGLLYQREPNLRCHLPDTGRHLVLRHCDADYLHQPHELNFWLACTPCHGSNALWVESAPGRGDYRPMALDRGQLLRFYGHQCDHYTVREAMHMHTRTSADEAHTRSNRAARSCPTRRARRASRSTSAWCRAAASSTSIQAATCAMARPASASAASLPSSTPPMAMPRRLRTIAPRRRRHWQRRSSRR